MRCEWPVLRRCCLCVPLRFGLLGLGYFKLALDLLLLVVLLTSLGTSGIKSRDMVKALVVYGIGISLLIVDVVLNILFIHGSHKKDATKLRVFYRYSLVMLGLTILWTLAFVVYVIVIFYLAPSFWFLIVYHFIIYMTILILGIIVQVYIIILVINEVKKLESNRQFQFTNQLNETCAATAEDQPPTTVEVK